MTTIQLVAPKQPTKSIIHSLLFSKWGLITIALIFVYVTGGFDIIKDNPEIVVFMVLVLIVISYLKK